METDEQTHCLICGQEFVAQGCGTGYVRRVLDDALVCYSCAADDIWREVQNADPGDRIGGVYFSVLSEAGRGYPARARLSDWPGNPLGWVAWWTRKVGFGGERTYFTGRLCGRAVHGNGPGDGMYCNVRISKA